MQKNEIYFLFSFTKMNSFDLASSTKSVWSDVATKRFDLYVTKDTCVNLGVDDCIIWGDRHEYAKIVQVIGNDSLSGPRGFIYLPWRNEGRWATPQFSLRGDPRFVICYPGGTPHYGLHIPLHTIRKDEVPLLNTKSMYSKLSNLLITPLRFEINKQCLNNNLACRIYNENTYHAKNENVHIEISLFKFETSVSKYLIDIKHISGCEIEFQDFILEVKF